jgi:hypothetical protein
MIAKLYLFIFKIHFLSFLHDGFQFQRGECVLNFHHLQFEQFPPLFVLHNARKAFEFHIPQHNGRLNQEQLNGFVVLNLQKSMNSE